MTQIDAYFSQIGDNLTINKNKKMITNSSSVYGWNTGYISLLIEPNKNNIFIANFKIIKCCIIIIGIECDNCNSQNSFFINGGNDCYGYCSDGGIFSHNDRNGTKYSNGYGDGDEIELKLSFHPSYNTGTLQYSTNGSEFKDTKYKVCKQQKIKIAVSLCNGNSIQLLSILKFENNKYEKNEKQNYSLYQKDRIIKQLKQTNSKMSKELSLLNGKSNIIDTLNLEELDELLVKQQNAINIINEAKQSLLENELKCIICYHNRKNIVIADCGHMDMCDNCAQRLLSKICPRCQISFENVTIIKHL